jgi:hypothetical protein
MRLALWSTFALLLVGTLLLEACGSGASRAAPPTAEAARPAAPASTAAPASPATATPAALTHIR